MQEGLTAYEWCIHKNIKLVGLEVMPQTELMFYTEIIPTENDFDKLLIVLIGEGVSVIENTLHLKSEKYLELRMYSLVPYNLLGIQMGIQHEHSVIDYVKNFVLGNEVDERFVRWATEWKTSILLNGGTSNEGHNVRHGFRDVWYIGSMQTHLDTLKNKGVQCSTFYEPDLNSMLTGISFIVDERVFNRKLYKDFEINVISNSIQLPDYSNGSIKNVTMHQYPEMPDMISYSEDGSEILYAKWLAEIGGEKNVFLREFLSKFQLARG